MNTKNTPGPWNHTPMQDTVWANDGETKIATISDLPWVENPVTGKRHSDFETEQANARLIAAAPELLEALQEAAELLDLAQSIVEDNRESDRLFDGCKKARNAIAKATGEPQ